MKEFKGTRDKLSVKDYGNEVRVIRRKNRMIDDIAQIDFYLNDLTKEENKANAVLFSSAYELLEALIETDKDLCVLEVNMAQIEKIDPRADGMTTLVSEWRNRNKKAINKALGL